MIEIELEREQVTVGGLVTGRVSWQSNARVRRVIASAEWRTRGQGNEKWGVGRSVVVTPAPGASHGEFPFRMLIPHQGPVSYEGQVIAIEWFIAVQIDQLGFDETAQKIFRVEPRRVTREV